MSIDRGVGLYNADLAHGVGVTSFSMETANEQSLG